LTRALGRDKYPTYPFTIVARRAAVVIGRLTACNYTTLKVVIKGARRAKSAGSPKSKKDLDNRILMLDEILKRNKLLLRDKKSLNLGCSLICM